jgi:hypothetical protein
MSAISCQYERGMSNICRHTRLDCFIFLIQSMIMKETEMIKLRNKISGEEFDYPVFHLITPCIIMA